MTVPHTRAATGGDLLPLWLQQRYDEEVARLQRLEKSHAMCAHPDGSYARKVHRMIDLQVAIVATVAQYQMADRARTTREGANV